MSDGGQPTKQAVLGLDLGTNGIRAGVFAIDSRRPAAIAEEAYPTSYPAPSRAEQNPADWWRALRAAVRRALADAGHPDVLAITAATFSSTVVVCDRAGGVLAPAILWMDARAAEEARLTGTVEHPVLADSGGSDASEWLVPKAMWIARHEPALWARSEVVCEALDYINFRLTGVWVGSLMNATCKWNYDGRARRFCPDLYALLGIADLLDRLPATIVEPGGVIGPVPDDVARELGIRGRPLVVQGGIDAHMGTFGANTIEPGSMLVIGGTSNVLLTQVPDDGSTIRGVWGPYPNALTPGLRMIEGGQVSAGSVLKWLTEEVFMLDDADRPALMHEVAAMAPDADGLLALDFFMGCRTPYRDPRLRGAFLGMTLSHGRAALYRAALTAICLGTANVIVDLEEQGVPIDRLVLAGGIMRNPIWLRATVDAIGKPVDVALADNLTLVGAAAAAAAGVGLHDGMRSASAAWRVPVRRMTPDPEQHGRYRRLLADYRAAAEQLAPLLHALADRADRATLRAQGGGLRPSTPAA
ncbi:FGGY-family carbohydrate kinase [Arenibaculum pallidiluteum]|uniref:FGGY-family carbohydrate kinase n=1 Tax=Arenibaculum pallidiluteum TaxID=2812559 RepID=UPI001A95D4B3|nr:FGGY-family carbohydrate kinase [Arenibaculum pallidiluteum]